jgi:hypothetical protein
MYASFLGISDGLYLEIFHQPPIESIPRQAPSLPSRVRVIIRRKLCEECADLRTRRTVFIGAPGKSLREDIYFATLEMRLTKVLAKFFEKRSCMDSEDLSNRVALIFINIQSV